MDAGEQYGPAVTKFRFTSRMASELGSPQVNSFYSSAIFTRSVTSRPVPNNASFLVVGIDCTAKSNNTFFFRTGGTKCSLWVKMLTFTVVLELSSFFAKKCLRTFGG
jgi:hypothetical protein